MSHIDNQPIKYSKLIGVGVMSTLLLIGCNKTQDNEDSQDSNAESGTQAQVQPEPSTDISTDNSVDIIACDDSLATVNLTQSIRSAIAQNVHTQMREFGGRSNTPFDQGQVDVVLNSILIDIAEPKVLQIASAEGMQTCQANLSFTLPTEDIYRANNIYTRLDEGTLQQRAQAQNLAVNNNMIVDKTFTYVVGNQAGQTVAKIAGQPKVIQIIADLMTKSQLKVAVDEQQRALNAAAERRARLEEQARRQQQQQSQSQSNQSSATSDSNNNGFNSLENMNTPTRDGNGELQAQSNESNTREVLDPDTPSTSGSQTSQSDNGNSDSSDPSTSFNDSQNSSKFTVPTDETIEVIILEEEGTY